MSSIIRTNSTNPDFQMLVRELDSLLRILDGEDHAFYDQFNKIDSLNHVIVLYEGQTPIGCGALKPFEKNIAEIKRMFVRKEKRGQGIASKILLELENWAKELGFDKVILETGEKQTAAINLYKNRNYDIIENYGQYKDVENRLNFGTKKKPVIKTIYYKPNKIKKSKLDIYFIIPKNVYNGTLYYGKIKIKDVVIK